MNRPKNDACDGRPLKNQSVNRHGPTGALVCAAAGLLLTLGLFLSGGITRTHAKARSFEPGNGVFVASGGTAAAGMIEGVSSIGQPICSVAINEPWSLWTGVLVPYAQSLKVQITPVAPAVAPAGEAIAIEVVVVAGGQVEAVRLHYRQGGQSNYMSLPMTFSQNNTWTGDIPAGSVALRGVEYYVEAHASGRAAHSPSMNYETHPWRIHVEVIDSTGDGALATTAHTYRMISFPAVLPDSSPSSLTDDLGQPDATSWRCGVWDPDAEVYLEAGQDPVDPFIPGRAAWLITHQGSSIDFTGRSTFPSTDEGWVVPLKPGWNQIANPFSYQVSLQDLLVDEGDQTLMFAQAVTEGLLEAQPLHEYDGTTYQADNTRLSPWTGYFVANLSVGKIDLVVPARESSLEIRSKALAPLPADRLDWLLKVEASRSEGGHTAVELGTKAAAEEGWDCWDLLLPPPAPGCGLAASSLNEDLPERLRLLQRDVRSLEEPGIAWTLQIATCEAGPIELSWDKNGELPPGYSARLVDNEKEAWVELTPTGSYTRVFSKPGVTSFIIALGTPDWLDLQSQDAGLTAGHLVASIIGENPSHGGVDIRLIQLRAEFVNLRAYDAQGRLVRSLTPGRLSAGVHVVHWDARTDGGEAVPAGVYFLRLIGTGCETKLRSVLVR